jgi:hypothetical protein
LVGLDQPGDRAVGAGEVALERVAAAGGGVLGPQRLEPAVELRAHERGVLEQPADLVPHERFELIGADRAAVADAPADVAPVVLADVAVVDDLLLGGAGRGAVAGVAALAADDQSLQRAGRPGVALGELGVARKALLRERERLVGDQRRDRDEQPLLDRLVDADLAAAVALAACADGVRRAAVAVLDLRLAVGRLAAVAGLRSIPQTVERSHTALPLRVGIPCSVSQRASSAIEQPSSVQRRKISRTTSASESTTSQ